MSSSDQKRAAARRAYMRQRNPYTGRPSGGTGVIRDVPAPAAWRPHRRPRRTGQVVAITIAVLLLAAGLFVLLAQPAFILNLFGGGTGSSAAPPAATSSGVSSESLPPEYDPAAWELDEAALGDTLLAAGADAGGDYLNDTLFIGDTLVALMMEYPGDTGITLQNGIGVPGLAAANAVGTPCVGFAGMADQTIPEAVRIMQPLRVVLCFGDGGADAALFAQQLGALAAAIGEVWPHAGIILAALPPATAAHDTVMQQADRCNTALARLAKENGYSFLNWGEALRGATGYADEALMQPDGRYPAGAGAQKLAAYARTHPLDNEDTRPRPLNAGWERTGQDTGGDASGPSSATAPPASSQSPSATQPGQGGTVRVFIGAAQNGGLNVGGNIRSSVEVQMKPGESTGVIVAFGNPGYRLTGWQASAAGLSSTTEAAVTYTVPQTAVPGGTITVMAYFEYAGVEVPSLVWGFVWDVVPYGVYEGVWQVTINPVPTDGNAFGTIIAQSPWPGSIISADDPKAITVNVATAFAPDLSGTDYANITEYGGWAVTRVYDPGSTLPAGSFVGQYPGAGSYIDNYGTGTITVTIAGPAP